MENYTVDLRLISTGNFLAGYRDDSLETVKRNEQQYGIPLCILSYKELYGWTMDEIVAAIGHRNNCTFCGVFRRQALDRGAALLKADKMATGECLPLLWLDDLSQSYLSSALRQGTAIPGLLAAVLGSLCVLPKATTLTILQSATSL